MSKVATMRRITKLGSISLAIVIVGAGLLALDLFGGAEAAPDAPLLYKIDSDFPVVLAAYAQEPVEDGPQVHAHVLSTPDGDTLEVRPRGADEEPLWSEAAADGDEPWRIIRLQVARDGTSVAAGTDDGRLLYLTSDQTLYDTFTEFRTGSPVTSLNFDSTGEFLSVATIHGDLYLFGRTHHTTQGSFILHVPAPIPAGGIPGVNDPVLEDAGTTARDELFPLRGETPFTGRPFVHTALAGHADGPSATDAQGLFLVGATAYGELYTYDLGGLKGPGGSLGLQPHVHRLDEGACTKVETQLGDLEVPCSRGALERLLDRLPDVGTDQAKTTKNVLESLARQIAREIPLDAVLSPMTVSRALPLAGLEVTQGQGVDGDQLVVAAMNDGTLEAVRLSSGSGQTPQVKHLWTHKHDTSIQKIALSSLYRDDGSYGALLAVADDRARIQVHRVTLSTTTLPSPHLETSLDPGPVTHLDLSDGDPEQPSSATAGRYLFAGAPDGTIRLYQSRDTGTNDQPLPLWAGQLAVAGRLNAVDLLDTGGVIAAGDGLAVYASLITLDIDAPAQVDRHKGWKAQALIDAPDTTVETIAWRVEHTGEKDIPPVTGSGEKLTHTFTREGDYRVTLTVKDDRGIEVSALQDLRVGGKNPVIKMNGPATVTRGAVATFDFTGTHDPNLPDPGQDHGIRRIEVRPFGDSRSMEADLDTLTIDVTYDVPTGVYRSVATAYDAEGRSARTYVRIIVTAPGFLLDGDRESGLNRVQKIAVSPQGGQSVAYGGDGDQNGRLIVRDDEARVLYEEGTPSQGTDRHVESGAITRDGSLFIGGRTSGEALRLPLGDPDDRSTLQVFDDEPVSWTFLSHDGERVLFVSPQGRFAAGPGTLEELPYRLSVGREIVQVVADERLINVVALTANGEALLIDGHRPDRGVRDEHTPQGDVRVMAITPNLDPMGRAWVFFGAQDGHMETWRVLGFDIAVQGRTAYDEGLAIHQIAPGRVDERSRYTLIVTTTLGRPDCPRDGDPCGRLHFVDSAGERTGGVPVPARSIELPRQPAVLASDPHNERALVASTGTTPTLYAYDRLLDEGPVAEMGGFDARIVAGGMTQDRAGHLIVDHGRHAWTFAPPTAALRLGPHDGDGEPMWGERLHSHVNTTLDAGPSGRGHGQIVSAEWDLDDEVLEGTKTVHRWEDHGYKKIRLTVTARVEEPVETLLIDRVETIVPVYPRPPVALLEASPFNSSAHAVTITSGETVQFDASSSHHPAGASIQDYRFHFGTGSFKSGNSETKSHTYAKAGTYYAYVVVADEHGSQATSNKIKVDVENRAPQAAFLYSQSGRDEPEGRVSVHVPVSFDASVSTDPDGNVVAYEWRFPGGTSSSSKTPEFAFSTTGDQIVRLRVKDDHGVWSPWLDSVFEVDTGIRLKVDQDPPDGSFVSPTTQVTVDAFAHDLRNWPDEGQPQSGATITVKVYYDGMGDGQASEPYETASYTTPADGWIEHDVGWSGTLSHQAGRHRVEVQAQIPGEYGETQWSETRVTTFRVEP